MKETAKRGPGNRIPLKDLELQILVALAEEEHHGWSIVKELQERRRSGKRILPGSFYRILNGLVSDGLIEESDRRPDDDDPRRRYFRLTDLGVAVCRAEISRLEGLVTRFRSLEVLAEARVGPSGGGEG